MSHAPKDQCQAEADRSTSTIASKSGKTADQGSKPDAVNAAAISSATGKARCKMTHLNRMKLNYQWRGVSGWSIALFDWLAHRAGEIEIRGDRAVMVTDPAFGIGLDEFTRFAGCSISTAKRAARDLQAAGVLASVQTFRGWHWLVSVDLKAIEEGDRERLIRKAARKAAKAAAKAAAVEAEAGPVTLPDAAEPTATDRRKAERKPRQWRSFRKRSPTLTGHSLQEPTGDPATPPEVPPASGPKVPPVSAPKGSPVTPPLVSTPISTKKTSSSSSCGRPQAEPRQALGRREEEEIGFARIEEAEEPGTLDRILADAVGLGLARADEAGAVTPMPDRKADLAALILDRQPDEGFDLSDHSRVSSLLERASISPDRLKPPSHRSLARAARIALEDRGVFPTDADRLAARIAPRVILANVALFDRIPGKPAGYLFAALDRGQYLSASGWSVDAEGWLVSIGIGRKDPVADLIERGRMPKRPGRKAAAVEPVA